ncbi:MAG: hypothetical protein V3U96_04115 [Paracoccaceae bacterium]
MNDQSGHNKAVIGLFVPEPTQMGAVLFGHIFPHKKCEKQPQGEFRAPPFPLIKKKKMRHVRQYISKFTTQSGQKSGPETICFTVLLTKFADFLKHS